MNRLMKPIMTMDTIKRMEDMSFFTYAQIFDDLLIIAQKETNCFVLKTTEGLIVIDAIWPSVKVYEAVINAIKSAHWDENTIKKLVLTHGHADHTGCGKFFVENHHVDTYLSKVDDIFWQEHPIKPDRPETWKDYSITNYIKDGDRITLGDKTIYVYGTPGHTPGCLSYIFEVKEEDEIHTAALWGGTTPPWTEDGVNEYLQSLAYFAEETKKKGVDVALSNHTAIDQGQERIAYSKSRLSYMPNIYILGEKGVQKYLEVFKTLSYDMLNSLNKK